MAAQDIGDGQLHRGNGDRIGRPPEFAIALCVSLLACGAVTSSPASTTRSRVVCPSEGIR